MNVTEEWTCYHCRETVQLPTSPTLTSILIDEHAATCEQTLAEMDAEWLRLLHAVEQSPHFRNSWAAVFLALSWVAAFIAAMTYLVRRYA